MVCRQYRRELQLEQGLQQGSVWRCVPILCAPIQPTCVFEATGWSRNRNLGSSTNLPGLQNLEILIFITSRRIQQFRKSSKFLIATTIRVRQWHVSSCVLHMKQHLRPCSSSRFMQAWTWVFQNNMSRTFLIGSQSMLLSCSTSTHTSFRSDWRKQRSGNQAAQPTCLQPACFLRGSEKALCLMSGENREDLE